MRWLLLKDLQILKRSPLLTALLVIYPIVLAVLIGFAVSRGPEKPKIAFLNEIQAEEGLELGGEGGFSQEEAFDELCRRVDCVNASDRQEALDMVEDGEDDRVDHEQRRQQRRAAQDLQVLQEEPAHSQWPFFFRNRTKSASTSAGRPFGLAPAWRRSAGKVPSKTFSPSASTSSRSP